jgi:thymidylate synthase
VCNTQKYFRLRDGKLELHSHSRANDAYRLLLLDMQLASCIHHEAAKRLDVEMGTYIHFSDSLHFYNQYAKDIEWQRSFMDTATIWQV